MRRSGLAAGVVAVSLLALAWVAAPAEAGGGAEVQKDVNRSEGSFLFTNPCNGDKVSGTFTLLWVDHLIFDGSGHAHVSHHESLQNATAGGSVTGTTYRVILDFTFIRNWDNDVGEPPPFEESNSVIT